jgi:uncharacterized protein YutE (UPF0331/DUF86 family)
MTEYQYAKGRIAQSIQFLSEEMREFEEEYADKQKGEYQRDKKLQKLIDRTVENILTALIEICGTVLAEEGVGAESYSDALRKCSQRFGFSEEEQANLARLAAQRNRLAHRYLNFRWEAIRLFGDQRELVLRLAAAILENEAKRK